MKRLLLGVIVFLCTVTANAENWYEYDTYNEKQYQIDLDSLTTLDEEKDIHRVRVKTIEIQSLSPQLRKGDYLLFSLDVDCDQLRHKARQMTFHFLKLNRVVNLPDDPAWKSNYDSPIGVVSTAVCDSL